MNTEMKNEKNLTAEDLWRWADTLTDFPRDDEQSEETTVTSGGFPTPTSPGLTA